MCWIKTLLLSLIPLSACGLLATQPTPPVVAVTSRVAIGTIAAHSAFPSVALVGPDEVVVVFREGSSHISRDGRIAMSRSRDGGQTFSDPVTIVDTEYDDRDPALAMLSGQRLALSFFGREHSATATTVPDSSKARHLLVTISQDAGISWGPLVEAAQPLHDFRLASRSPLVELADGTVLWPTYHAETGSAFLYRSEDGGSTWEYYSVLADSSMAAFGEPVLLTLSDSTLLASFRTKHRGGGHIYVSSSNTSGETWSSPRRLDLWGYPQHLLLLRPGLLFMTYGYRRPPIGVRYAFSYDFGQNWISDSGFVIDGRSVAEDAGYPTAVRLSDGTVFVVYYLTLGPGQIEVWGARLALTFP